MKKFYEVAQEGKEERDGTGPEGTHVRILLHGATDPQQRQLRGLLAGIHCQLVLHGSTKRGDSLLLGGYIARAPKTEKEDAVYYLEKLPKVSWYCTVPTL